MINYTKMTKKQFHNELRLQQSVNAILKKPKADHRHNWKNGKMKRIFGSLWHITCAVDGCNEIKVVGG